MSKVHTPEYKAWESMRRRVRDPKRNRFHRYGGRGIKICDRWLQSFESFLEDMGPRPTPSHSLDRIDNDGDYTPENCRWATPLQQARNTGQVHAVTIEGVTRCVAEWCEILGRSRSTFNRRLQRGWTPKNALLIPPNALGWGKA